MNLKILYEDNHLIAVYKPAGILVQAGDRKSGNLMDQVKKYIREKYKKQGNIFLGLVHRLDRPVSGIVVFAKTSKGASRLSEQFRNREVNKIYSAVIEGDIQESGHLIHFLKKDPDKLIAIVKDTHNEDYQKAELTYEVVKSNKKFSLIKINLKTGRFNQIRAQFSHIGHPVAGDTKYGALKSLKDHSIALCATQIIFKTATNEKFQEISIPYPEEWDNLIPA